MFPPSENLNLDITAISGICGSISIACWVVVFSPQIVENFRRGSADGLSLHFIIVWLLGDVFNILGAVLQGVLPTMLILAIYYTIADMVLLGQCFYYRGFTWRDEVVPPKQNGAANGNGNSHAQVGEPNESTGLLGPNPFERDRRGSSISITHLSPLVPLIDAPKPNDPPLRKVKSTRLQATLFNLSTILTVCAAGVLGWYISERSSSRSHQKPQKGSEGEGDVHFNLWGQIFGYICAVLYLGSRIPQLALNFRRKSTEGVSMLFFLFACIGNLTYVLSIFAYESKCGGKHGKCRKGEMWSLYWRYILVNASWLAGSAGTLLLDLGIFAQFFIYREKNEEESAIVVENGTRSANRRPVSGDQRPLLQRGDSLY